MTTKTPQYLWGNQNQSYRTNVLYTVIIEQAFVHRCFSCFSSITEKLLKSTMLLVDSFKKCGVGNFLIAISNPGRESLSRANAAYRCCAVAAYTVDITRIGSFVQRDLGA